MSKKVYTSQEDVVALIKEHENNISDITDIISKVNAFVKTDAQALTDEQKIQARTNIGAVSLTEVEELLGVEEEFSETGSPLILNLDQEKEIEVISKISRPESSSYYDAKKLTLY